MTTSSQVSIHNLKQLVRNAGHPEIEHYDALMKAMFGNKITAIKVFNRLLRWLPYSKRADGAVYKSARELAEETASSEIAVARQRNVIEAAGFDIFVKKANGAPTNHFKLNLSRFFARLAEIFGATVAQVQAWMTRHDMAGETGVLPSVNKASQSDRVETAQAASDAPATQNVQSESYTGDRIETAPPDKVQSIEVIESITSLNNNKNNNTTYNDNNYDPCPSLTNYLKRLEKEAVVRSDILLDVQKITEILNTRASIVEGWFKHNGQKRVSEVVVQSQRLQQEGKIRKSLFGYVQSVLKGGYVFESRSGKSKVTDYYTLEDMPQPGTLSGSYADLIRR